MPARMTLDEFLVWDADDTTGRRWQLIDGEPVLMAPAGDRHAAIHAEIARLLGKHLRGNHLLAIRSRRSVAVEPGTVPRVRANENCRVPDIGVTCSPPTGLQMVEGCVLSIEILSPGNEAKIRSDIWACTTIPTVQEILVVRQTRMEVELLRRDAEGNWPAAPTIVRPPDPLELASIGYIVPVADIYRTAGLAR
jgi:Uma2 family endonuclease